MMDLHSEIINIQATPENIDKAYRETGEGYGGDTRWLVEQAYKRGHRDARHAAAELVVKDEYEKQQKIVNTLRCINAEIAAGRWVLPQKVTK